jgi:hypothetical protein
MVGPKRVQPDRLVAWDFNELRTGTTRRLISGGQAHVYLRLPDSITSWKAIPDALLVDCASFKANSIEGERRKVSPSFYNVQTQNVSGDKRNDLTIIYPRR